MNRCREFPSPSKSLANGPAADASREVTQRWLPAFTQNDARAEREFQHTVHRYRRAVSLRMWPWCSRASPVRTKWDALPPSREEGHFREPNWACWVRAAGLLHAGQLRQLGDGCLVVIDPGAHHVRGPFGTQAITELAGALLLAGLRPPILDPDAGRLLRCIAKAFRQDVLPPWCPSPKSCLGRPAPA